MLRKAFATQLPLFVPCNDPLMRAWVTRPDGANVTVTRPPAAGSSPARQPDAAEAAPATLEPEPVEPGDDLTSRDVRARRAESFGAGRPVALTRDIQLSRACV